jgi:hypothetical protein
LLGGAVELDFRQAIDFQGTDGTERDGLGVNAYDQPVRFES